MTDASPDLILLVDDDAADRDLVRRYLERGYGRPYRLYEAATGTDGLALLRAHDPAYLLLDYLMPDMDGLAFLDAVQAEPPARLPATVMLTSHGDEHLVAEALKRGAQEYIVKDELSPARLALALRSAAERAQIEGLAQQHADDLRFLRSIVEYATDSILVTEADLEPPGPRIVYTNPAFEKLTGYSCDEVIGKTPRILQGPDTDRGVLDRLKRDLLERQHFHGNAINYRKDGTPYALRWSIFPIRDETETITHWVAIQQDVTEYDAVVEALEQSQARFERAVRGSRDGLWEWHVVTNEVYLSPQFKAILGYADDEMEASFEAWRSRVHPDDLANALAALNAHLTGQSPIYEVEFRMRHKDGSYPWILSRGLAERDAEGRALRMAGSHTDITRRKETEAELQAVVQELADINRTLDERVAQRTEALEAANRALERRNRELQDFTYVASHDLQEPLRKVRAFANLLVQDYDDHLDDDGRYYLERMQNAAARMSTLINDLLAFSRVQTHAKPFEPIDLNTILQRALSDLELQLQETNAQINALPLPAIEADPTQMYQLLLNLIGNALKFRRDEVAPFVTIQASLDRAEDHASGALCRLTIADNGIGFDEKYLDRIFTPFQRLHNRSDYEGTGIGLAICRRIVERHDGTITAHSSPGDGATFVVTLPTQQKAGLTAEEET